VIQMVVRVDGESQRQPRPLANFRHKLFRCFGAEAAVGIEGGRRVDDEDAYDSRIRSV
jgi:hypothetical protein